MTRMTRMTRMMANRAVLTALVALYVDVVLGSIHEEQRLGAKARGGVRRGLRAVPEDGAVSDPPPLARLGAQPECR
jgi:hypothetical protein